MAYSASLRCSSPALPCRLPSGVSSPSRNKIVSVSFRSFTSKKPTGFRPLSVRSSSTSAPSPSSSSRYIPQFLTTRNRWLVTRSSATRLPSVRQKSAYPATPLRLLRTKDTFHSFRSSGGAPSAVPVEKKLDEGVCTVAEKAGSGSPVRIVALVGEGSTSPLRGARWEDVMAHTATRMKWVDEGFEMSVFTDSSCVSICSSVEDNLKSELARTDILVIVAMTRPESVNWIKENSANIPNIICFDSSSSLINKLGGSYITTNNQHNALLNLLPQPGSKSNEDKAEVINTVSEAWERRNSDDIRFCLLVIINAYIRPVPVLQNLRSKGFSTLTCMVQNCGTQILECLLDPNCRKALQCLNSCSPVDQVCNYQCIASYESPKLEAFSLCVLQKHNCLELDAKVPENPRVPAMSRFRGEELTHEVAEDLFVGWLGRLDWSWRVVAGQNPAYDQFPCQYQLFYRGKAKGSFWYEPVFQVKTLDGRTVWRRRRYRVKRGGEGGTFLLSVLDNGVVSNEFWTIVDVVDDLSWGLFHYHGAARVAGQSYTGAVLVSQDGQYPRSEEGSRLVSALEKCGIKEWELFMVDNRSCKDAPLGIPEGSRLHSRISVVD